MKIEVKGKGPVTLTKANFVGQGGEGQVYAKSGIAYKIYTDDSKMIPAGKIAELAAISNPNIIKPENIILNKKKPVGYTMRYVKDTYAICQLFTKAFRNRNNLTHDTMLELVKQLRQLVHDTHAAGILVVDVNEMNFLSSKDFGELYAIDVDSYQTKSYPATAIMDSVRDRHAKTFTEGSDWFSFGIISFQMFTGIHPYKGKHGSIKTLDERMLKNISVFNKSVSVPKVCYPFDVIPEAYRNWYQAVFERGDRLVPPGDFSGPVYIVAQVKKISGSNNFVIEEVMESADDIIDIIFDSGRRAILSNKQMHIDNRTFSVSGGLKMCMLDSGRVLLAKIVDNKLELFDVNDRKTIDTNIGCSNVFTYDGNLFVKNDDSINYIDFTELPNNLMVSQKSVAKVLGSAASVFRGVVVQNLLDSCYVSMFPMPNKHVQIRIPELEGYKVIDGKFDSGVLMVLTASKQKNNIVYDRFVFRFDRKYEKYDIRKVDNVGSTHINFVVLDTGIVVCLNEDEEIEAFSSNKDDPNMKTISDDVLSGDMILHKATNKLYFSRDNKLFSMSMK